MFRNRELVRFTSISSLISLAAAMVAVFFSFQIAIIILLMSIVLICAFLLFTFIRYREIEKLTNYLRKIMSGEFQLDVRDNKEGELSILKNEIYKMTIMLSKQTDDLKEEKMKLTDAISDISHQLKTPLTSMVVMTDLLSNENLPKDKRKEFTKKIQLQLERIDWLVSSLLKLSKIDAKTAVFKRETIYVKKLMEKAIEPLLIPLEIKNQTLDIRGQDDVVFTGDFHWTMEAVINILKNCIEHTPEHGIISISFAKNALYTEIVVEDNGKGIAKEDLPYIFKRFYKGKNAGEDSVGIGLAMAYSIITSQNGDIEVRSEEGQGTTFFIKFYNRII
ncbi:sensor histidine kinase [Bacillus kwashiorkori]|uniref:sensor histidine kinase n=1 Tax=Bacillus kwashiorkori TaxID=1522318 RepID=UPI0007836007|nr:HAMP domain-containing sensor histidine kinase [Bacillus kwashiorkori]